MKNCVFILRILTGSVLGCTNEKEFLTGQSLIKLMIMIKKKNLTVYVRISHQ